MAKPTTVTASKMLVKISDKAATPVFTAPCGITTKALNFSKDTNDTNVPDCANPDAPAWKERGIVALSAEITESGIMAMESLSVWQAMLDDTTSRATQVWLDVPLAQHGGHWDGNFHLTGFQVTGEQGNKVQTAITMLSDGPVVWVPALT